MFLSPRLFLAVAQLADVPSVAPDSQESCPAVALPSEREVMVLVHNQMRMLAGSHPDLDDLAQSALEQVLRARFEHRSAYKTFVRAICYRVWMKHLRWTYRFHARFLLTAPAEEPAAPAASSSEGAMEARERYERLYSALERVSPKRRAVVVMHDIGEASVAEIAEAVEAPEATVRTRLRDGRKRLRQLLLEDPYFGPELTELSQRSPT